MSINYHQYEGRVQQSSLALGGLSPDNDLKPKSLQAWRANLAHNSHGEILQIVPHFTAHLPDEVIMV